MPALDTKAIKQRDDPDDDHEEECSFLQSQLREAESYHREVANNIAYYDDEYLQRAIAEENEARQALSNVCLFSLFDMNVRSGEKKLTYMDLGAVLRTVTIYVSSGLSRYQKAFGCP